MSFLYFCCIEALLTYLLRTNKTAIIIASLLINCLLSVFTSHPLLQDLLLIESLCFLFYYYSDRLLSEIIFYLSFLTVIKNLVVLIPISPIVSLIIYILIISTFAIIQKLYPIDNKNLYWCKSQYKNVGLGQYKNVGFPTFLYCLFSLHLL